MFKQNRHQKVFSRGIYVCAGGKVSRGVGNFGKVGYFTSDSATLRGTHFFTWPYEDEHAGAHAGIF